MLSVIIVAAGTSSRMGFDKLMVSLLDHPIVEHTINAFYMDEDVNEIIVVGPENRFNPKKFETVIPIKRVDGGENRHDSVANGLAAVSPDSDYIAVHDGARPLITPNTISEVLRAAQEHGAASAARRVTETVKRANEQQFITESVERENLWLMETPQIFRKDLLLKAYDAVMQSGTLVTDEVSALEMIGVPTYLVANPTPNLKVTYPEDINLAEILLRAQSQT